MQINLLPWREQQRQMLQQQFIVISVAVGVFALLLLLALWSYLSNRLNDQLQANQLVSSRNQQLAAQVKQLTVSNQQVQPLLERMQFLHALQGQRPVTARLLDELVRVMPAEVYTDKISRTENSLVLEGWAANPNAVTTLIHQLDQSSWFEHASMRSFVSDDQRQIASSGVPQTQDDYGRFSLTVDLAAIAQL